MSVAIRRTTVGVCFTSEATNYWIAANDAKGQATSLVVDLK